MFVTVPKANKYRSGFERKVAESLKRAKIKFSYETLRLPYIVQRNYIPDFILPNGVIIETKGRFTSFDRTKILSVKRSNPERDIRLVFQRASNKLYKGSKTTYGQWASENGIKWSEGFVPKEWLKG